MVDAVFNIHLDSIFLRHKSSLLTGPGLVNTVMGWRRARLDSTSTARRGELLRMEAPTEVLLPGAELFEEELGFLLHWRFWPEASF